MELNDIQPDRCYRTRSGTICKVTAIRNDEDRTVSFIRYDEHRDAGGSDEMPGVLFAANAQEETELVDPQGNPLEDAGAATPV